MDTVNKIRDFLLLSDVEDVEKVMTTLNAIGFFKAPASSRYHLAVRGGLAQHTLNVIETAIKIKESVNLPIKEESLIKACICHDLNKCYRYTLNTLKSGQISSDRPFKIDMKLVGDGELSAFIASAVLGLELTAQEYHAIRYHNVFDIEFKNNFAQLTKDNLKHSFMLIWLVQTADMYASQILES